jgi:hypothetical protein
MPQLFQNHESEKTTIFRIHSTNEKTQEHDLCTQRFVIFFQEALQTMSWILRSDRIPAVKMAIAEHIAKRNLSRNAENSI